MSKYQLALYKVKELTTKMYADFVYRVATKGSMILLENEIGENLETLQQIIDIYPEYLELKSRATPMKPIIVDETYHCPNCKQSSRLSTYESDCSPNYDNACCGNCGQAIDWSENE